MDCCGEYCLGWVFAVTVVECRGAHRCANQWDRSLCLDKYVSQWETRTWGTRHWIFNSGGSPSVPWPQASNGDKETNGSNCALKVLMNHLN